MKKVGIFTTFLSYDRAYSLCGVAAGQIKMFLANGYKPIVIVTDAFKDDNVYPFSEVELRKIPVVFCSNEGKLPDNYQEDEKKLKASLREVIKDLNVVITHDIIYQPAHLIHNIVSRELALEFPNIKWLHWIHSATSHSVLCNKQEVRDKICQRFPNSLLIYPNTYDIPRVARNYNVEEDEVKCVNHPIDVCGYLGFQDITKKLIEEKNILNADVIGTYPLRLDRGKQPHIVINVFNQLKKMGKKVCLIIADFHSTGGDKVTYRNEMINKLVEMGLNDNEIIFTSQYDKSLELSCPREMIRDLMLLSNVFILPSRSETYSLIAQEAMLCNNFVILNQDFPPFRSIYKSYPKYFQFSSNINAITGYDGDTNTKYDNPEAYWSDIAKYIVYELANNRILAANTMIRKERNIKAVFKNQLEPLLYV